MVGEVREYDELAGIYEKLDTVRIPTSTIRIKRGKKSTARTEGRGPRTADSLALAWT